MTEAQQFVEGLQTGKLPQCDRCGHYTLVRSFISGQLICPDCEHKLAITPPRKQPYFKVRSAYHDGEKMICRDVYITLDRISSITSPSMVYPDVTTAEVIVQGHSISIHPDDYPALLAAFEAWHA